MMDNQSIWTILTGHSLMTLAAIFLMLSILHAWWQPKRVSTAILFTIFLLLAVLSHVLSVLTLPLIVALGLVYSIALNERYTDLIRVLMGFFAILFSLPFALHIVPGVHNFLVVLDYHLTTDSVPYSLYLNFDKPLIGFFIVWFSAPWVMINGSWKRIVKQTFLLSLFAIIFLMVIALLLGFTRFEPKFDKLFLIWAPVNLLFVCVAEEAFFRGYLLRYCDRFLASVSGGQWISLFFISFLFGLAHYPGGLMYVLLAMIAGLFYGYIYQKTKSLTASIMSHFSVNLVHFLFFTYPALAGVTAFLH